MDLDGTLISVSSEKELVLSLAESGGLSPFGFLRFLAGYGLHPLRTVSQGKGWNRRYLSGLDSDSLQEHCHRLAESLRRRVRPGVAEMVRSWAEAGTRVVLVSATLDPLARDLADLCGASRVVASVPETADGRLTGRLAGPRPWGRSKANLAEGLLREMSIPASAAAALGDSWSDRHVMAICGRPVAVCPDRRLRRLAVSEGWRIIGGGHTGWA